jgi:anti-anti-sigma factor
MQIETDQHDVARVLRIEGDLDGAGSAELEERFLFEQQEGALHFVIDLGGVSRITGPGLRVLLGLARNLPSSGGSLVLCQLERKVEEALQVSGLDGTFELAPDRAQALARSKELQSGRPPALPVHRAEATEKIDLAIELLGSIDPRK